MGFTIITKKMNNQETGLPLIRVEQDKKISKLQADFNTKIKKISELKESIENVKKQIVEINQRLQTELTPVEQEHVAAKVLFANALVDAYHATKLSKKDAETLSEMIRAELWSLIDEHGKTDLIEVYDQFCENSYAEEKKEVDEKGRKMALDMFENMTGMDFNNFDFGEEDTKDMNDFERMHRMREAFEEKMKEESWKNNEARANRKKTPKQEAKDQKMKAEAEMLTRSSRVIYMELAKELHPDRELDEAKRAWKTEILQRVTAAYNVNDLYELLRIRLEYRQSELDPNAVPEQQLQMYVKILKEQIIALQQEYHSFFNFFDPNAQRLQQFGLGKAKQVVTRAINKEKKEIRTIIEQIEYTMRVTLKDPKELKEYIKENRQSQTYDQSTGNVFDSFIGRF